MEPLIFEKSSPGRRAVSFPYREVAAAPLDKIFPEALLRKDSVGFPALSELDVVRHYTRLSQLNFSVDTHCYPLGSCTMKYNPKINEALSALSGFNDIHPYQAPETVQGMLELMYTLEKFLCEITGCARFTFQPSAGAHGELSGMKLIAAYHQHKASRRHKVIVPDSSHGTNPASAAMCGYEIVQIKSTPEGLIDIKELEKAMTDDVAALMLTNPNTLGLFEKDILKIVDIVHSKGALLYYDGANLNALLGIARPGDMGFDVIHINLHKTFSTPHGGGGPGAGPLGVSKALVDFLPAPVVDKKKDAYVLNYDIPHSIGKMRSFYGNIAVLVKAYCYIVSLGNEGLVRSSKTAILNANYIKAKLSAYYELPYPQPCMHEVVFSAARQKEKGVSALDIAKRLIDYGIHPPTVYFPLIVKEALMIEPTETESKETLDYFIETMVRIAGEAESSPELLKEAPHKSPVQRLDEVKAAMDLDVRWKKSLESA